MLARLAESAASLAVALRQTPLGNGEVPVPFLSLLGQAEVFSPFWIEDFLYIERPSPQVVGLCDLPTATGHHCTTLITFRDRWCVGLALWTSSGPDLLRDVRECTQSVAARLYLSMGEVLPLALKTAVPVGSSAPIADSPKRANASRGRPRLSCTKEIEKRRDLIKKWGNAKADEVDLGTFLRREGVSQKRFKAVQKWVRVNPGT